MFFSAYRYVFGVALRHKILQELGEGVLVNSGRVWGARGWGGERRMGGPRGPRLIVFFVLESPSPRLRPAAQLSPSIQAID